MLDGVEVPNPDCADSETYYRMNGECVNCPSDPGLLLVFFVSGLVAFAAGAYYVHKKNVNLGVLVVGVDYLQVLSIFATTAVRWPSLLDNFYTGASIFSFNVNLTAPECSFNMSYERKWWIIEITPLVVFAAFFLAHLGKYGYKRIFKKRTGRRLWAHVHTMIGTCVAIMYYCTCVRVVFWLVNAMN